MTPEEKQKAYFKSMYRMSLKQEALQVSFTDYDAIKESGGVSTWNGVEIKSDALAADALVMCGNECEKLLIDFQNFCQQQQYNGFPIWESAQSYKQYAQVVYDGVYYEALQDNTGKAPDTSVEDWVVYDINDPNS
jgi:hypothetical protein